MYICPTGSCLYISIHSSSQTLLTDGPLDAATEGTITILSAESLPVIQAHINRLLIAGVFVGDDCLAGNTLVCHGDGLGAELVVLSLAELVKDVRGNGDEGHVGGDFALEVGAQTAGARVVEDLAAARGVAELEDGAIVGARGDGALLNVVGRGGRNAHGQSGDNDRERELHFAKVVVCEYVKCSLSVCIQL